MAPRFLIALLVPALLALAPTPASAESAENRGEDPRLHRDIYVSTESQAFLAARQDARFAPIGRRPIAQWVSENWFPTSQVKQRVRAYAKRANQQGQTPLVAIFAIPNRDCGGYSGGGLSHAEYRVWITRLAAGLRGKDAMAILEPDALGLLGACGGQGDRTGLMRFATKKLTKAGVWVYIDAGHNAWIKPGVMAKRLIKAGIGRARGFSVNVASFVRTDVEKRYAKRVIKALKKRGVKRLHYVMDTSRNGNGQVNGNDWCNPLTARLGRPPEVVAKRKLDAYLWVKAPGESDGDCNGGPYAGAWWPDYALRLLGH